MHRSPNHLEEKKKASNFGEGLFQYRRGIGVLEAASDILRAPREVP
jgi:hypothetical protein